MDAAADAARRLFPLSFTLEQNVVRTEKIRHKRKKNLISGGAAKPEV